MTPSSSSELSLTGPRSFKEMLAREDELSLATLYLYAITIPLGFASIFSLGLLYFVWSAPTFDAGKFNTILLVAACVFWLPLVCLLRALSARIVERREVRRSVQLLLQRGEQKQSETAIAWKVQADRRMARAMWVLRIKDTAQTAVLTSSVLGAFYAVPMFFVELVSWIQGDGHAHRVFGVVGLGLLSVCVLWKFARNISFFDDKIEEVQSHRTNLVDANVQPGSLELSEDSRHGGLTIEEGD